MSHFNDNFKLIFKAWQSFLNEGPVSSEDAGKSFVNLFVKSPESAQHALDLINAGLKYYNALMTAEVNSDEYESVMDALTLPGQPQDKSISNQEIIETIEHFENIKVSLEKYIKSNDSNESRNINGTV